MASALSRVASNERLLLLIVPGEAAIEEERCAGGVGGVFASEEDGHICNIVGSSQALEGNVLEQRIQLAGIVQKILVDGRFDRTGRDGVDGDAQWRQLDG